MADHSRFLALAERLIAKHGRSTVFKTLSAGPSDITKPWKGAGVGQTPGTLATALAVFMPHKGLNFGTDFLSEELLKDCTELCLVAGSAGNLETCNLVEDGGKDFKVTWVSRLKPADLTLLYAIGINR
jgi:hypothetical protein